MNQDQVKAALLRIEDPLEEFTLIFSGKSSKKVNGLYKPDLREIIIHNRNFEHDGALLYTAIHEYAHHIHCTGSPLPVGPRAHTREFRTILHRLLEKAEKIGVYQNPISTDPELTELTERIRNEFLTKNGTLMKEFGAALVQAEQLCRERGARFEDYVERVLQMDQRSVTTLMRVHALDLNPAIGFENMAAVASIRSPEKRREALSHLEAGKSPDTVKSIAKERSSPIPQDPLEQLEKERARIQRTIQSLESKLSVVEHRIAGLGGDSYRE